MALRAIQLDEGAAERRPRTNNLHRVFNGAGLPSMARKPAPLRSRL